MTVRELGRRMDSAELTEWRALYEMEPWGDERRDLMDAQAMSLLAAAHGVKDVKLRDFLLQFDIVEIEPEPEADEVQRKAMRLCVAMGGSIPPAA